MKRNRLHILIAVLFVLAVAAAAAACAYLYARTLHEELLDGRREIVRAQTDYVSSFDLFAEESWHQTQPRISGWLNFVAAQAVQTQGARGALSATLYAPVEAFADAPWAIVLHGGLGTTRAQVQDIACELSLAGYFVLTPDLHAHGQSAGEGSTLGLGDAQDVRAWIEWIGRQQADARIVLMGQGEGAVAALLAASEGLDESVAAVAADSAFDDGVARALSLAGVEEGTLKAALLEAAIRLSCGPKATKVSDCIAAADVPLLLIHGTGDQDVPAWQSEDIALAAGENAQLLLIEGAGHGLARYIDAQTYYGALLAFFESALN